MSKRLQMLANMVTRGNRVVDIGCDHGFLPIYLVREGICPRAVAMDVRKGPLEAARGHIEECGLGDYIELRLSDGLAGYAAGEADTLVCAGLGGRLMERILKDGADKAGQMKELILQPQSELPQFRAFLRDAGFAVTEEDACLEDGKYYFAMRAVPGSRKMGSAESAGVEEPMTAALGILADAEETAREERLHDLFGELLLEVRHPVLQRYLRQRESYVERLGASLAAADSGKGKLRAEEIRRELEEIRAALSFWEREG